MAQRRCSNEIIWSPDNGIGAAYLPDIWRMVAHVGIILTTDANNSCEIRKAPIEQVIAEWDKDGIEKLIKLKANLRWRL